jgi:murein DD-endopeptidase MepM/ murein hydrolase activator NlpD
MLASIPSIQPVSNKDLNRIASGFGFRIDPIYKIAKFHAGLDFTAPAGTPIYATGNGVIEIAEYNPTGYGNNIWIKHGFGYRTHYCHMIKLKASQGQSVKRGEIIGWVGSTGKSTGPHCHYEVEKNAEKIYLAECVCLSCFLRRPFFGRKFSVATDHFLPGEY